MGFFDSTWQQSPLAKQTSSYYGNALSKPNLGYDQSKSQLLDPVYNKALDNSKQQIAQMYANLGWGIKNPLTASTIGRATSDINTQRANQEYNDQNNWRRQVLGGAHSMSNVGQYQPSAASQFAAPIMQGLGRELAPQMAKGLIGLGGQGVDYLKQGISGLGGFGSIGNAAQDYTSYLPQTSTMFGAANPNYGIGEEAMSGILGDGLSGGGGLWDSIKSGFSSIGSLFGW